MGIPSRMFGGKEITKRKYPWLVYLYINFESSSGKALPLECTGSIISRRAILTAGHCVLSAHGKIANITIVYGTNDKSDRNNTVMAKKWFAHPLYSMSMPFHDIGIIITQEDKSLSESVSPICLSNAGVEVCNFNFLLILVI